MLGILSTRMGRAHRLRAEIRPMSAAATRCSTSESRRIRRGRVPTRQGRASQRLRFNPRAVGLEIYRSRSYESLEDFLARLRWTPIRISLPSNKEERWSEARGRRATRPPPGERTASRNRTYARAAKALTMTSAIDVPQNARSGPVCQIGGLGSSRVATHYDHARRDRRR